jgi:hypothetical protein
MARTARRPSLFGARRYAAPAMSTPEELFDRAQAFQRRFEQLKEGL